MDAIDSSSDWTSLEAASSASAAADRASFWDLLIFNRSPAAMTGDSRAVGLPCGDASRLECWTLLCAMAAAMRAVTRRQMGHGASTDNSLSFEFG
jgi:hypothetical protein